MTTIFNVAIDPYRYVFTALVSIWIDKWPKLSYSRNSGHPSSRETGARNLGIQRVPNSQFLFGSMTRQPSRVVEEID